MNKLFVILPLLLFIPLTVYAASADAEVIEFRNIGEYISFENKMKQKLDMPIIAKDYKTGKLRPDAQITTDYTKPIFAVDKTDRRVMAFIDNNADRINQKIISKQEAINQGWNFEAIIP